MDRMDAVRTRRSVRTFQPEPLRTEDEAFVRARMQTLEKEAGPFGHGVRLLLRTQYAQRDGRIGTYGVIRKAAAFLVVACPDEQQALFDCGFLLERLVLDLTERGIGTCWLGGTFRKKNVWTGSELPGDWLVPVVIPLGYAAQRTSLAERIIKRAAGSQHRSEFTDLFQYEGDDPDMLRALEAVRLAPSSQNKQPWRVTARDGEAHFFLCREGVAQHQLGYDIQTLDLGIGAAHYAEVRVAARFEQTAVRDPFAEGDCEYMISVYDH